MNAHRAWIFKGLLVLLVVTAPVVGNLVRRGGPPRCAWDGQPIEPRDRVQIVTARLQPREFCCVQCAQRWLDLGLVECESIFVTDEIGQEMLPADQATFVWSSVVTRPKVGNRIHVFASPADAAQHVQEARGRILAGRSHPFFPHAKPR